MVFEFLSVPVGGRRLADAWSALSVTVALCVEGSRLRWMAAGVRSRREIFPWNPSVSGGFALCQFRRVAGRFPLSSPVRSRLAVESPVTFPVTGKSPEMVSFSFLWVCSASVSFFFLHSLCFGLGC